VDVAPQEGAQLDPRASIDALNGWFDRQQRAWWKSWKWVVYAVVAIVVLHTVYEVANNVVLHLLISKHPLAKAGGVRGWLSAYKHLDIWRTVFQWVGYAGTVLIALSSIEAFRMPSELVSTFNGGQLFSAWRTRIRRAPYIWFTCLLLLPWLLMQLSTFIALGGFHILSLLAWVSESLEFLFVLEVLLYMKIRYPQVSVLLRFVFAAAMIGVLYLAKDYFISWISSLYYPVNIGTEPPVAYWIFSVLPFVLMGAAAIFLARRSRIARQSYFAEQA
jgi:hypothetical protein